VSGGWAGKSQSSDEANNSLASLTVHLQYFCKIYTDQLVCRKCIKFVYEPETEVSLDIRHFNPYLFVFDSNIIM
jgi:hypothetical protein